MTELARKLKWFPIVLPIVFVLLFFGVMPVKYNAVFYTDNIKGEGICLSYFNNPQSFSSFYKTGFYFGSELKKASVLGYHYDVQYITLEISDVSQFDIVGIDSYVWGIHLMHYDGNQLLTSTDKIEDEKVLMTTQGNAFHVEVKDSKEGVTIYINKVMIPPVFWVVYFAVILLASVLICMLVDILAKRWPAIPRFLMGISGIIVALLAGQFFCGSLPYVEFKYFLLNWLFLYALSVIIGAITIPWIGTVATMGFTTFWYIANYFVIALRGKPIMPADLRAMGTAAEVMGGYTFKPTWEMIVGVAVVVLYAVGIVIVWRKQEHPKYSIKKQLIYRGAAIAAAVIACVIGINTSTFKNLNSFAWDAVLQKSFHQEGMVLTFLKNALNAGVKRPEGYSREKVDEYLAEYKAAPPETSEGVRPTNIIMVMNEAFSDLRTVGLDDEVDVMPFIDSLDENTVEGRLHVGVFGGGTCNTEFEGLTGNTLAFLSAGAYPYTSDITGDMFSLAAYFRDQGYLTESFHANEPQNWNRNMVYPYLGFDQFNSISDYAEALGEIPYLHGHPADQADYDFIEKVSEENQDKPRFLFNVTMQNHSGYEKWEDVEEAESVSQRVPDLYMDTRVYLSLVKASDDAVKQLVETYKDSDEPTMIVFFGDHQPGLPAVAQSEIYTEAKTFLDYYTSKFFIWTNYDSEAEHDAEVSANYLPYLVMKQGNFPMSPYVQMLEEVYEKYPIISSMGVIDKDGEIYASVNDLLDDPLIQKYQYVQYANMFDEIDEAWFEAK